MVQPLSLKSPHARSHRHLLTAETERPAPTAAGAEASLGDLIKTLGEQLTAPEYIAAHPTLHAKTQIATFKTAAELMAEARQAQRDSGKTLQGRLNLDDGLKSDIRKIFQHSAIICAGAENIPEDDARNMLLRFEEMCRRREIAIPPALRPAIHRLLAIENLINAHALGMPPHKTLAYTLHEGAGGPALAADPRFAKLQPWVIARAAFYNPAGSERYLLDGIDRQKTLAADPRFAKLPPWAIARAAFHNPAGSERYLLDGIKRRDALAADPRFAALPPSVIAHAAFYNPAGTGVNPQASAEKLLGKFLRGEMQIVGYEMRDGVVTRISDESGGDPGMDDDAFDIPDEIPGPDTAPAPPPAPGAPPLP